MASTRFVRAAPILGLLRHTIGMGYLIALLYNLWAIGSWIGLLTNIMYCGYMLVSARNMIRSYFDKTDKYYQETGMNLYIMDANHVIMIIVMYFVGTLRAQGPLFFLLSIHAEFNTAVVFCIWMEIVMKQNPGALRPKLDFDSFCFLKNVLITAKTCIIAVVMLRLISPMWGPLVFGYLLKPCALATGILEWVIRKLIARDNGEGSTPGYVYVLLLTLAEMAFYAVCIHMGRMEANMKTFAPIVLSLGLNNLIHEASYPSLGSSKSN